VNRRSVRSASQTPALLGLGVLVVVIVILRLVILIGWRDGGREAP
jgi:hypothetical protein